MTTLAISGLGMVTGVGMSAATSCAAVRCAIDNFQQTGFRDDMGAWLMGSEVPLEHPWRGATRLLKMAAASVRESLEGSPDLAPAATALILCLPETDRPGRPVTDDRQLLHDLQHELALDFHAHSVVVPRGRVAVAVAIDHARQLLAGHEVDRVIVVATDTMLVGRTLKHHEQRTQLLTSENSDGFIPGEAAASFVVERPPGDGRAHMACIGLGFGVEKAHIDSGEPLRADGLTAAIKGALHDAGCGEGALKFKIIDASGAQYQFKEASLAFSRLDRTKRKEFAIWHPADCVGEVGAAIGAVMVGTLRAGFEKGYAMGERALMHLGNDAGQRAALVFAWQAGSA